MPRYLIDTSLLIDFGRVPATRMALENALNKGATFVIGPPALIELVRGLVASGSRHFENDKQILAWLVSQRSVVLPLPRPFMAMILHSANPRRVEVEPCHYDQLIQMIVGSATFDEFLRRSEEPQSNWKQIAATDDIHNGVLDREFGGLETLARAKRIPDLAARLSNSFGAPGKRPIPLVIRRRFSAALEFLESALAKMRGGAKPRVNDPGVFVDFQLLLYLADPEISFLTKEDFSSEIKKSTQKDRVIGLDSLQ